MSILISQIDEHDRSLHSLCCHTSSSSSPMTHQVLSDCKFVTTQAVCSHPMRPGEGTQAGRLEQVEACT